MFNVRFIDENGGGLGRAATKATPEKDLERQGYLGELLFKKRIWQLETLMFVGAGIEQHQRAGAETFDPTDVVSAKAAPLV